LFFGRSRPTFECSYQKVRQAKLTSINIKFTYHITNIFFLNQNFNSSDIIFYMDSHSKKNLLNHVLTTHDVSKNARLDQILKYNLGYHKLMPIKTYLDYLHHLRKDVFAMIRQF